MATKKHTVIKNGDKLTLQNTLCLEPNEGETRVCLKDIVVDLPTIPGATVEFTSTPDVGTSVGTTWTIGDYCEESSLILDFTWCVVITDIEIVEGEYNVVVTTSTTQDVGDDLACIEIVKECPEIGTEGPEEDCEVTETIVCYQPTPIPNTKKKQFEKIQVRTSKRVGTVKRKIARKVEGDNCGLDNLKVS